MFFFDRFFFDLFFLRLPPLVEAPGGFGVVALVALFALAALAAIRFAAVLTTTGKLAPNPLLAGDSGDPGTDPGAFLGEFLGAAIDNTEPAAVDAVDATAEPRELKLFVIPENTLIYFEPL